MSKPADAMQIFTPLRTHCIRLRRDYNTYTEIFNESNQRLLSKIAPTFFSDISEILQRDWVLQACKLADPPVTMRKGQTLENISVELLNNKLNEIGKLTDEIKILG